MAAMKQLTEGTSLDVPVEIENVELEPRISTKTIILVIAVVAVYFAQLVGLVGSGLLARDIAAEVGGEDKVVWVTAILTITAVALGPSTCEAADYFGRKWFLVIQTTYGFIGCMIVSRATNMATVLGGQAMTSLAYAAQPLLHAVVSEVLPRKHRPIAQAAANVAAGTGGVLGLLVGGALTNKGHSEGFRPYFYITAGIFGVSTIAVFILYNPPPRELQTALPTREKLNRLDWLGASLLTIGVILTCMALSWSQNPYEWNDAHILATFVLGISFLGATIIYEWRHKKNGIFNHELFGRRNFVIAAFSIFLEGLAFFASNNYFNYELSVVFGADTFHASLHYSVAFLVYTVTTVFAGIYCSKQKSLRWPVILAFISITIYNALMATLTTKDIKNAWGYPVLLGCGMGVALNALVVVAQLSTPPELISLASGLMLSLRSLGGTFGVCIYNAIFSGGGLSSLYANVAKAIIPMGAPSAAVGPLIQALKYGDIGQLSHLNVSETAIQKAGEVILHTYLEAFRHVWIAAAVVAAVAAIACAFIKDPKEEFNSHIDAPVEIDWHSKSGSNQVKSA